MPDKKQQEGWMQRLLGEEPPTHMDGPTDKEIAMARLEADRKMQPQRGRAICEDALRTINGERQDQYGNPEDTFEHIANLWTTYLSGYGDKILVTKPMVAEMMCLLKIAREQCGKGKRDNMVDLIGYAALAADMRGYA